MRAVDEEDYEPAKPWLKWLAFALIAVFVVCTGWMVYSGFRAKDEVEQARVGISNLAVLDNVTSVDLADAIKAAREHAHTAYGLVHDPVWWFTSHAPISGNIPMSVVRSTEVVDAVLSQTYKVEERLRNLPASDSKILDPDFLQVLGDAAGDLEPTIKQAIIDLRAIDTRFVPDQLTQPIMKLANQLDLVEPYLGEASAFAKVAPSLLGLRGPTRWLVVFGNGAEARPSGGFPGGWGVITADKGRLSLGNVEPNDRLSQYSLNNWAELAGEDAADFYGDDLSRVLDMGLSPDFSLTGRLMWNLYTENTDGADPIGILNMDEHALAFLLRATGPIDVDGEQLNTDNAVEFITRTVYQLHPDPADKDRVLLGVASKIFAKLGSGDVGLVALMKALIPAIHDGRVRAWAADPQLESLIDRTSLSSGITQPSRITHIVAVANGGGNKLEAYIQYNVTYSGGQCSLTLPYRDSTLRIEVNNNAPKSGLPAYVTPRVDRGISKPKPQGGTRELVYVHVPLGSDLTLATLDGRKVKPKAEGVDNERTVWRFDLESPAQTRRVLLIEFAEPAAGVGEQVKLWTQPMALPMVATATAGPACSF